MNHQSNASTRHSLYAVGSGKFDSGSWLPRFAFAVLLIAVGGLSPSLSAGEFSRRALAIGAARGLPAKSLAFLVLRPDGTILAEHRADEPMSPASNMKLISAMGALEWLGADFVMQTDLLRTGPVEDGVLTGDLVIRGRGDPSLSGRFHDGDVFGPLRPWVEMLKQLGVRRVQGRLLGDDRYFEGTARHPDWPRDQLDRWYCAPSGALNLNDNCVDVHMSPGDSRVRVWLEPAISRFELQNKLKPVSKSKQHVYHLRRKPGEWRLTVSGGFLKTGQERVAWVTVPDPTIAFLDAFRGLLEQEGITVDGGIARQEGSSRSKGEWLVARHGQPVATILPPLLKRSLNVYGDCLLRIQGRELGTGGSYEKGASFLQSELVRKGLAGRDLTIRDGSGLSSKNRVAARTLANVLRHAARQTWFPIYRDALAVAGVDGTLRKRFRGSPVQGKARAKTGHVRGVSTLSGYLPSASGDVIFVLFYQGKSSKVSEARRWQEQVLKELWPKL